MTSCSKWENSKPLQASNKQQICGESKTWPSSLSESSLTSKSTFRACMTSWRSILSRTLSQSWRSSQSSSISRLRLSTWHMRLRPSISIHSFISERMVLTLKMREMTTNEKERKRSPPLAVFQSSMLSTRHWTRSLDFQRMWCFKWMDFLARRATPSTKRASKSWFTTRSSITWVLS